jgi:5-methylcytosine-specific restriction endonuclease McrA
MPTGVYTRNADGYWKGKSLPSSHRANISNGLKGHAGYWKGKKRGPIPFEFRQKMAASARLRLAVKENHPKWQGGRTQSLKRWRIKNRDLVNFWTSQRKKRLRNSQGSHTFQEWEDLKLKCNFTCLGCKRSEPEIKLTQDHIIALKHGGTNYIANIQPLCSRCNSSKSAKLNTRIGANV